MIVTTTGTKDDDGALRLGQQKKGQVEKAFHIKIFILPLVHAGLTIGLSETE